MNGSQCPSPTSRPYEATRGSNSRGDSPGPRRQWPYPRAQVSEAPPGAIRAFCQSHLQAASDRDLEPREQKRRILDTMLRP
eukprot:3699236-Amphidinium_carterae.1